MLPDDPRHGTRRGYYAHRRAGQEACDDCRRAAAGAQARYDYQRSQGIKNRLAPHGVQRRLQALVALGYTWERLDDELGEISRQSEKWALGRMAYVFPSTHAKVAEVYERLSMTLPPTTTPAERGAATRSRNRAKRNGWLPPLAWDDIDDPNERPKGVASSRFTGGLDPIVVDRILAGDSTPARSATPAERREVVRRWRADGRGMNELERLTGWRPQRYIEEAESAA